MKNVSDKSLYTFEIYFVVNNFFFENLAFHGLLCKSILERSRPQMVIRCMRIAGWIHYIMPC